MRRKGERMRRTAVRAAAGAMAAGLALCGCADLTRATAVLPAQINPESPIAPAAVAAARESYAYPRFRDVPPRPTDLPTPAQMKTTVIDVAHERRAVLGWTAANPPMVGDTAGYAAQARSELAPDMIQPVDPLHAAAMEAYAAAQRKLITPPPPLPQSPPPVVEPAPPPKPGA